MLNVKLGVHYFRTQFTLKWHFRFTVAALNLFINSNGQELLKEMKPDLRRELVRVMTSFVEKLFAQVPYDAWITD